MRGMLMDAASKDHITNLVTTEKMREGNHRLAGHVYVCMSTAVNETHHERLIGDPRLLFLKQRTRHIDTLYRTQG